MATPPTLAYYEVLNTGAPLLGYGTTVVSAGGTVETVNFASVTVADGDVIVVLVGGDSNRSLDATVSFGQSAGTAILEPWVQAPLETLDGYCFNGLWTTTVATGGSMTGTVSITCTNLVNGMYGASMWVATGSTGIGAYSLTQAAQEVGFTTTADNSAVVALTLGYLGLASAGATFDPNAGTTPPGAAVTSDEISTDGVASQATDGNFYSVYAAHWANAGVAGTDTYGLNSTTESLTSDFGDKYNVLVVEIFGGGITVPVGLSDIGGLVTAVSSACAGISQAIFDAEALLAAGIQPDLTALTAAVANLTTIATAQAPSLQ